jgi:CTP synthase (UTP-ammonia lyase)
MVAPAVGVLDFLPDTARTLGCYASEPTMTTRSIGVLIDLPPHQAYHVATLAALSHAADGLHMDVAVEVITTDQLAQRGVLPHAGLVIGPGSPYRDAEAVLSAIGSARERCVPLVGT